MSERSYYFVVHGDVDSSGPEDETERAGFQGGANSRSHPPTCSGARDSGRPRGADHRQTGRGSAHVQERALCPLPLEGGAADRDPPLGGFADDRRRGQARPERAARRASGARTLRELAGMGTIAEPARGCPFMAASFELDDRPGPVRDFVVQSLRDWADTLAGAARIAVQEGHFRADLDCEQFAHECGGIALGFVHASRLIRDPKARARAETVFEALLRASRASSRNVASTITASSGGHR